MDRLVFFHKTPALWDKSRNWPKEPKINTISKMKKQLQGYTLDSEMSDFFSTDIYFQICKEICVRLGIKEFHIIHGYNEGEQRNWSVSEKEGWCQVDENTTYWSFTEPGKLLSFMDSSLIITRGNYPKFHQWLSDQSVPHPQRFWLHYPATSIRFPHLDVYQKEIEKMLQFKENSSRLELILTGMGIEHNLRSDLKSLEDRFFELIQYFQSQRTILIGGPYTMVLADDEYNVQSLSNAFPNSVIQTFVKPALWHDDNVHHVREYDSIYCGTSLQSTKNHQCFVQLLKHLDAYVEHDLKIVIAGNKTESKVFDNLFVYPFSKIKLIDMGEVSREQLHSLFSNSRTMIVTSGRDANPRIIQESLVHGARVISIDTLSDGLDFISSNPLLGAVLPSDTGKWKYARNGNLAFESSIQLASLVSEEIGKSYFPDLVMNISRKKLSLENSVRPLINTINSFR